MASTGEHGTAGSQASGNMTSAVSSSSASLSSYGTIPDMFPDAKDVPDSELYESAVSAVGDHVASIQIGSAAEQDAIRKQIEQLKEQLSSGDESKQRASLVELRKLLSQDQNPPIGLAVEVGLVPSLVAFLPDKAKDDVVFEVLWVLTNVSAGSSQHTLSVLDSLTTEQLNALLQSSSDKVKEQTIWLLGNIAGDSVQLRDFVIASGVLPSIVKAVSPLSKRKLSLVRSTTWAFSNFCRGKPSPGLDKIKPILPVLAEALQGSDLTAIASCAWALSFISAVDEESIAAVLSLNIMPRLIQLLTDVSSEDLIIPVHRLVANIVAGNNAQAQVAIDAGCVAAFKRLLDHPSQKLRREATWALSNITAGTSAQAQVVLDAGIVPKLVSMLQNEDMEVRTEVVWVVFNTVSNGIADHIRYIGTTDIVEPLCAMLHSNNSKIQIAVLDILTHLLVVGAQDAGSDESTSNPYCDMIEACRGQEMILELMESRVPELSKAASHLMGTYFSSDAPPAQ